MPFGPSDDDEQGEPAQGSGWVPPESRPWRHPSEFSAAQVVVALAVAHHRWRRKAAVVGAASLLLVGVGALLLVQTGAGTGTDDRQMPITTAQVTGCCTLSASLTRTLEESVVSLETASSAHRPVGCGVIVGDSLVATTVSALGTLRTVRVVAVTGQVLRGVVIAADRTSGIVALRLSGDLPAAHLTTAPHMHAGQTVLAVSLRNGHGAPQATFSKSTVVSVGTPAPGTAPPMASITVGGAGVPAMPGEALVDREGRVAGILGAARGAERAFVPMPVVDRVSTDLLNHGQVRHGWLGLTEGTAPHGRGAKVEWVDPKGAAAGALRAGDVIVSVDGAKVVSGAALRAMLYLMPPGQKVSLAAMRGSEEVHAVVRLAPSP